MDAHNPIPDAPTVSVVICAYTDLRWSVLSDAVESVLAQRPAPLELILVIDHNDALLERARAAFDGRVALLSNEQEHGLSGARNTGLAHARGDVVAFLDDDARARPGWLASLTRDFADERVIGTGGVALPQWQARRPAWFPDEFLWVVGCSYRGLPVTASPIRNPLGATMAFRRRPCVAVGGFAHGIGRVGVLPLGCEETELAIRLRASADHEVTILQVPDALVDHVVDAERARWRYFRARCWSEGISKATVAASVGREPALASERAYALRTLPVGVLRGLGDGLRGDLSGLRRAAVLVAGLAITTAGFARGSIGIVLGGGVPMPERSA
jgi:GT2 family glycosyltransferase